MSEADWIEQTAWIIHKPPSSNGQCVHSDLRGTIHEGFFSFLFSFLFFFFFFLLHYPLEKFPVIFRMLLKPVAYLWNLVVRDRRRLQSRSDVRSQRPGTWKRAAPESTARGFGRQGFCKSVTGPSEHFCGFFGTPATLAWLTIDVVFSLSLVYIC